MREIKQKLSLVQRIEALFKGEVPTSQRTLSATHPNALNPYIANKMTVDNLQSILRSAESGDCSDLFDLYRDIIAADSHIQAEFQKRKIAVLLEIISAQPVNKDNPDDVRASSLVQEMLDNIPDRVDVLSHLLDSTLYPLSVVEKVFKKSSRSDLNFEVRKLIPVEHRLIDLRSGKVNIYNVQDDGRKLTDSQPAEASRYIIHRGHILRTPDCWGGPMRALLFWWLFSVMDTGWWASFLERFGTPFLLGKYDKNDNQSRYILQRAFEAVQRLGGLVISKETQVEVQNALSSQNGDSYEKFLRICEREKSKLILGQTLSAEAQSTGLNSGNSELHNEIRNDIKLFDCTKLAQTLRDHLVVPFMRYNGIKGAVPKIIIGGEQEEDMQGISSVIQSLSTAGIRLTDEAIAILGQRLGLTLERSPSNVSALPFSALEVFTAKKPEPKNGVSAVWDIASTTAADIAKEYSESSAEVERILNESKSPEEFQAKMKKFCASWPPEKVSMLIQDALTSNLINGATPRK